jgi:CheY-like chemotaxis protein
MTRVLIADDSLPVRMLLHRVLTMNGHEVVEAHNGEEACELLVAERPDVAILDIVMPGPSGIEICKLVRADPTLASTGLIVLSANLGSEAALAAGADAFLNKPFRPQDLLETIADVAAAHRVGIRSRGA